ncbi:NAD(P)/FAD-dependent oxidoreductase [Pelagibius sp. Alg239-R121]|uniref:NAD(P)/FAD-dependent oxidoreductase n=1 Tax=Pelagibius sp. Alg239-R121 TaxID=2993448 RepID=UPI0024A675E4|nr:NAD(P)/FAD-dependent oxidoreductase [Pelagibius sp. Alg239-R121]
MTISRRRMLGVSAAAVTAASMSSLARAASKRVVVIGGGAAGATVARYLAKDSKGDIDVVLVEASERYTTCFFSNWYLGGFRTMDQITHDYKGLESGYGIRVVHALAQSVDAASQTVGLSDGSTIEYDRLVAAPGIDFRYDLIDGYDESMADNEMPHAYKAGPQTALLRKQLEAMDDGGVFLMAPPPNPYRCPPGPYERASTVAHYLKTHKPKSKILIVDPKDKHSKQALFREAWETHYPGMVEWLPGKEVGALKAVRNGEIVTEKASFKGQVLNPIPAQKAGKIAQIAGLTDDSGWCPIKDASSFESALVPNVHVLGDACINGAMPKSAFSANSQAKVVSQAVRKALTGSRQFEPRFRNTCWSLGAEQDSFKVGADYRAEGDKVVKVDGFISSTGEESSVRVKTAREAEGWYQAITSDMFS